MQGKKYDLRETSAKSKILGELHFSKDDSKAILALERGKWERDLGNSLPLLFKLCFCICFQLMRTLSGLGHILEMPADCFHKQHVEIAF